MPCADHLVVGPADRHQAVALRVVDVHHRAGRRPQVRARREEPEHPGLRVEALEEGVHGLLVLGADRADVNGGAVAQHHIGLAFGWVGGSGSGHPVSAKPRGPASRYASSGVGPAPRGTTITGQAAAAMTRAETLPSTVPLTGP